MPIGYDAFGAKTYVEGQVYLDGHWYFTERGSYQENSEKIFSTALSLSSALLRQEGGMKPRSWSFKVICFSDEELATISGSFVKVSANSVLPFSGMRADPHMVYFDSFGPIEVIDNRNRVFSVPVSLSAAKVGG